MNYNSLFPQTIFVSLNYCCWLEQHCTDKCYGFSVKFTEQPSNMQKHAFLCQRNCIYVYVVRKVYHGICIQLESVVDTPVDTGISVLADMYNWQQLVCATCPLSCSVWCEHCFLWPYVSPVIHFSWITGVYVGLSNIEIFHSLPVTLMHLLYFVAKHPSFYDNWQTLTWKMKKSKTAQHSSW